jgi:hypothetical protein
VLIIENLFKDGAYEEFARSRGYALWQHIYPNDVYFRLPE